MADIKKKIGVRISQLRMKAGMTQAKLAEKADLSIDSISRIERGNRAPSLESLASIATALGVEPSQLLNFRGKELKALAEGPSECLELWNLLKDRQRNEVRKVIEIARILLN